VASDVQHELLRAIAVDARVRAGALQGTRRRRQHPFAGSAYATSKAALAALTRELAFDLAPAGVRVNAIAPGEIDTAILSPGTPEIVERDIPMHRLGTTAEVANLIWFLCSPQAAYITGAEIPINGGQHV
jgi:NAD(P)-dependent dehydrogenase (short-subunit alcohol dehydrogenase family)